MKTKINRENATSLKNHTYVGITSDYKVIYAGLERIIFAIDMFDYIGNRDLSIFFFCIHSTEKYKVRWRNCNRSHDDGLNLYHATVDIWFSDASENQPALLKVYLVPENKRSGEVRMEINPQHYSAEEITDLFVWMGQRRNFGIVLYKGLQNAWITTAHYSLNVVGMKLYEYFFGLAGARKGDLDLSSENIVLTLGASVLKVSISEMVDVQRLGAETFYGQSLLMLDQDEFRRFLRIELRLSPGNQKLKLNNLLQMDNLFSRLRFYDRRVLEDQDLDLNFAGLLCHSSYPTARNEFTPASKINGRSVNPVPKLAKKRVDKVMKKYCLKVLDTDAIWAQLPKVSERLGILADTQKLASSLGKLLKTE